MSGLRIPSILMVVLIAAMGTLSSCNNGGTPMTQEELSDFATRYAAAWSSQAPARFARFYSDSGSLTVNGGEPAIGRTAIAASAGAFMQAFPDMVVSLDSIVQSPGGATFHWLWTGTNSGPGGTGNTVRMHGYEEWSFSVDGLLAKSLGHYDEAEYLRQVNGGGGG